MKVYFKWPARFARFPLLTQTWICYSSRKAPVNIPLPVAHRLNLLSLKERHPLTCVCLCGRMCVYVPEPCSQVKATSFVCMYSMFPSNTFPSIWRSSPLTHYTINQRFTVYAKPTHLPWLTHSQSDISQKINPMLFTTIHS